MGREAGDKRRTARALIETTVDAWPDVVSRRELERQPAIAAADGRTVHGQIRHLASQGVLTIVDQESYPDGRATKVKASAPAAIAIKVLR